MDSNNRSERIDPVDLIETNYEAVEMRDVYRLDIQNTTRALVAARHKRRPMIRWAIGLSGVAVLILILVLTLQRLPVPSTDRQAQSGITPPHGVLPRIAEDRAAPESTKKQSIQLPMNMHKTVLRPAVKKSAPHATSQTAQQLGDPMVVAISVQAPVTIGSGKALKIGDRVRAGDAIRTGRGGRVELVTRKGSQLSLDANSSLVLTASNIATIERGRLYCSNRDKEISRIDTPAGRVKLLGTVVGTSVLRKDTVAVTVVEGKVELSNGHGNNVVVGAGKRSTMVAYRAPQAGATVDIYKEIAWYHGRGDYESDFGDIMYTVPKHNSLMAEIWSVAADGGSRHRIRSFIGRADSEGWIPGERWIRVNLGSVTWFTPDLVTRRANWGAGHSIMGDRSFILDAMTGQTMSLTIPSWYRPHYSALSPNSELMVFNARYSPDPQDLTKGESAVWVLDRRDGSIKKLLGGDIKTTAAWSPDSRYIAISKGEGYTNKHSLVIVDTETGNVRDLGINGAGASFSPDGMRLAYSGDFKDTGNAGAWYAGVPKSGSIYVVSLVNQAEPVRVSLDKQQAIMPRWSPDGSRLLYVATDGVYVADANGTDAKRAFEFDKYHPETGNPSWTPDENGIYLSFTDRTNIGSVTVSTVAADGSGALKTIAAGDKDSKLPTAALAQTDAAAKAVQEAVFDYAMGKVHTFEGDLAARRESFNRSADVFTRLVWDYPLSGLGEDDALAYADAAAKELAIPDATVLHDACSQRMDCLKWTLPIAAAAHRQLPPDMATALEWVSSCGWQWGWLRSGDKPRVVMLGSCPGTPDHAPEHYLYTPPSGRPKVGDVLLRCPLHPDVCLKWDERCESRLASSVAQGGNQ